MESFHAVIDKYLDDCDARKKDPGKPYSGKFNLRLALDLHRRVVNKAEREGLSFNIYIENTLNEVVAD